MGRCSLTVALPVISAAGIECCCVPTAVLSNHTGFESYYIRDLDDDLEHFSEQFKANGIEFDAIYSAYLANSSQVEFVLKFIEDFRRDNSVILVDPVMGDHGKLYAQITEDYAEKMRLLCTEADVITPNLTEAFLLLGREYHSSTNDTEIEEMLHGLIKLGTKRAVITGIEKPSDNSRIGWYALEQGGKVISSFSEKYDISPMGTGDIFASATLAAILRGKSFEESLHIAESFTNQSVAFSAADPNRRFYGVNFEQALPQYVGMLNSVRY